MTPIPALVNPKMLIWARKKRGFHIEGVAHKMNIPVERLQKWEAGEANPTINQAKKLAEIYKRPLSLFFLDEPPTDFSPAMTDFRRLPSSNLQQDLSPELRFEIRRALEQREIMTELTDAESGIFKPANISIADNPEAIGKYIRKRLGINWDAQQQWRNTNALNKWQNLLENQNVLVFHMSHHHAHRVDLKEARGVSFLFSRFPVILLNGADKSSVGRIFTLLHEFTHLLLNTPGVCDLRQYLHPDTKHHRIEQFCNHAAGAALVPQNILLAHRVVKDHHSPEWADDDIEQLASDFSVSREVIVRRLLILNRTTLTFYRDKRKQYQTEREEYARHSNQRHGAPPYDRMILRNQGKLLVRQVLAAYHDNAITLTEASRYLGAKIKHIKKIEHTLFFS